MLLGAPNYLDAVRAGKSISGFPRRWNERRFRSIWEIANMRQRRQILWRLMPKAESGMSTAIELIGARAAQGMLMCMMEEVLSNPRGDIAKIFYNKLLQERRITEDRKSGRVEVEMSAKQAVRELESMDSNDISRFVKSHVGKVASGRLPVAAAEHVDGK